MVCKYVRKPERQCWSDDAVCRAIEVTEGRTVEQLLYFDLISIQTRLCSAHDEEDIKNEALWKVDEEIKSVSAMQLNLWR
jgi:hypothetical protein